MGSFCAKMIRKNKKGVFILQEAFSDFEGWFPCSFPFPWRL
jgi:hypothetical protein